MKTLERCLALLLAVFIVFGNLPGQYLTGKGASFAGIFNIKANAYYDEGIYTYYLTMDNKARIYSLNQYVAGAVVIPTTLGSYPVAEIGNNVFKNLTDITSVTVQAGVRLIDSEAFRNCKGLINISLPAGLVTIGDNVFLDCIKLTTIVIPDSVTTIGQSLCLNCTALTGATVGAGITALSSLAFSGCPVLKNVTLSSGLQNIGYGAFMDCGALTSIAIPFSVAEIQQNVFRGCNKLTGISFNSPSVLQALGSGAFYGCTAMTNISLPGTLTSFGDFAFYGCSNLAAITIPYGTTVIPESMFGQCSKLADVSLPNTVTTISKNAFAMCISLSFIIFPVNLTSIGDWAFSGCWLRNPVLPEGLLTIGASAFKECYNMSIVSIPSTVTALAASTFSNCGSLVSVTIPNNVINFGANVFTNCANLKIYGNTGSVAQQYAVANSIPFIQLAPYTVNFNANGGTPSTVYTQNCGTALATPAVTRIGYTFNGWSPAVPSIMPAVDTTYTALWTGILYTVTFNYGSSVTTYHLNYGVPMPNQPVPFYPDDLNIFTVWSPALPATVPAQDTTFTAQYTPVYTYTVSSGNATITGCDTAVSGQLNIPASLDGYPVTGIGYQAFQNCTGLTGITIPPTVTFIDVRAFYGCEGLTSITIPLSVTSVGNSAFENCSALVTVNIPDTLANIGRLVFNNTAWLNAKPDGVVYLGKVFYKYKGTMPTSTTVDILDGTLGIAGGAFSGCTGLTGITLPESLTVIGTFAFRDCTGIAGMIIPAGVTTIGTQAFQNCTALTLGVYPDSYAHIYANENDIPHVLVAKITFDANGGTGGTSTAMVIGSALTAPTVIRDSFIFGSWSPSLPATVPEGNTTYTAQWVTILSYSISHEEVTITALNGVFNGTLTIPETIEGFPVRYIANAVFKNKTGLTGVILPDNLYTIGEQTFRGCTGLTVINLRYSLTSIGPAAFMGCTNLETVIIPPSVETIGADAFTGCPGLTLYVYPKSPALEYAEGNHLNYKVFVTVTYSLNGGTGTLPDSQSGVTGNAVVLPPQGDITRQGYHFLGWATTAGATTPLASLTMAASNIILYAVWSQIPSLTVRAGSAAVIDAQGGYLYGLATGLTKAAFESSYISITGNGRLEYTPDTGTLGTGTTVMVIDNITGHAVQIFTVIIYGDINGDGSIDSIDAGKAVDFENHIEPWDPADNALYIRAGDINGDGNLDGLDAGKFVDAENYILSINQVTGQT